VHGWQNYQKRGGDMRKKNVYLVNRMWDKGQAYQQFFSAPGWKRNTPVHTPLSPLNSAQSGARQGELNRHADQLIEEREATIISLQHRQIINGSLDRLEPTPWLRFTAWHQHLAGFNREQLLLSTRPADDKVSEAGLASLTIEEDGEAEGLGKACRAAVYPADNHRGDRSARQSQSSLHCFSYKLTFYGLSTSGGVKT
jgi:hypothetical protein